MDLFSFQRRFITTALEIPSVFPKTLRVFPGSHVWFSQSIGPWTIDDSKYLRSFSFEKSFYSCSFHLVGKGSGFFQRRCITTALEIPSGFPKTLRVFPGSHVWFSQSIRPWTIVHSKYHGSFSFKIFF
jgi:hypothetical protein